MPQKPFKLKPTKSGLVRWGLRVPVVGGDGKPVRDANGKIKTRQTSHASREEAYKEYGKLLQDQPRLRRKVNTSFLDAPEYRQVAALYFGSLKSPEPGEEPIDEGTLSGYESVMKHHVTKHVGDHTISAITKETYRELYAAINASKTVRGTAVSANTRKAALRLFEATLKFAEQQNLIEAAPANPIERQKTRREIEAEEDAKERKYYPMAEVETMLSAADSLAQSRLKPTRESWARYRPMLYFLVYSGARISEARAFRREDYDHANMRINIRESAPKKLTNENTSTKTTSGRRWVPLNPELVPILEEYMATHNHRYVFATSEGNPMSLEPLYRRFLKKLKDHADELVAARANPRFVSPRRDAAFHGFRHFYASWLVSVGAQPKQLQTFMGHKKFSFTMDVYGHLFEDDGQDLAIKMSLQRSA